jgi:hypothetical protein
VGFFSDLLRPGVPVIPSMSTGATDMAQLRAKGIQSYGIGPAVTDEDRLRYGAHSDEVDEWMHDHRHAWLDADAAPSADAVLRDWLARFGVDGHLRRRRMRFVLEG